MTLRYAAAALALLAGFAADAAGSGDHPSRRRHTTRIIASPMVDSGRISIDAGKSVVIKTTVPYKRVNVAQPEIADFNTIGDMTILLTAKKAGSTQLIVWDDAERSEIVDVNVTLDVAALGSEIRAMFPESKIEVTSSGGGTIALRGRAKSLEEAEQMVQLASPHAPRVMNFLDIAGGRQVMLKVKFAEVSRTATNALGVNLGYSDGVSFAASNTGEGGTLGVFRSANESTDLGVPLTAGATGNDLRPHRAGRHEPLVLRHCPASEQLAPRARRTEPRRDQRAGRRFPCGGEYPIPVPQSGTGGEATITIEYREFGVKLKFVPIVLGDGRIRLKVSPEVSDSTSLRPSALPAPRCRACASAT
jgi:pilus assembly protein CpaC